MEGRLDRFDHLIYRLERLIVVASLAVMSIVVFLDVIHRTFASQDNRFSAILDKVVVRFYFGTLEVGTVEAAAPIVAWIGFIAVAYFGIRTAAEKIRPVVALGYATLGVVVTYGLIRLLIWLMPNGFIWSQPLALVLTLWVGFFGASMCTYDNKHLRVEAVQRYLPASIRPTIGFVSGIVTTAFTFALTWLSLRYVLFNYDEYVATEGQGGLFIGLDVPKYLCFAALPLAFAFMTLRFGLRSIRALDGEIDQPDAVQELIEQSASVARPQSKPSDLPTEITNVSSVRRTPVPPPSDVPTEIVAIARPDEDEAGEAPALERPCAPAARPSDISTDPHPIVARRLLGERASDDEEGSR